MDDKFMHVKMSRGQEWARTQIDRLNRLFGTNILLRAKFF